MITTPEQGLQQQGPERFKKSIERLRSQIANLEKDLGERMQAEATVRFLVEGEGGGEWFMNVRDGDARLSREPAAEPLITIQQTAEALRLGAESGGFGGQQDLTRGRIARMRGLRGTMQFRVTGLAGGQDLAVKIHFGPGDPTPEPRATISVTAEDAKKMQTGALNAQAAFMQGKLRITGDAGFAMQVGLATA